MPLPIEVDSPGRFVVLVGELTRRSPREIQDGLPCESLFCRSYFQYHTCRLSLYSQMLIFQILQESEEELECKGSL
ncbi:unnamed protein product [Moneuplotes crassus]|uniref:Uncharacterized protein n=1 Tax=Euplotes crassus TaxID=5936 RepID=A0AAD1UQN0_EUPCR|nr:unnamed protein product [Moneuplotes crassus]